MEHSLTELKTSNETDRNNNAGQVNSGSIAVEQCLPLYQQADQVDEESTVPKKEEENPLVDERGRVGRTGREKGRETRRYVTS